MSSFGLRGDHRRGAEGQHHNRGDRVQAAIRQLDGPFSGVSGNRRRDRLAEDGGVPVRAMLSSGAEGLRQLEQTLGEILAHKKARSAFQQPQIMATIGG